MFTNSCFQFFKALDRLVFTFTLLFLTGTGRLRQPAVYVGGMQPNRGTYIGNFGYQQPVSYAYQQGLAYPPYGYVSKVLRCASKPTNIFKFCYFV